MATKNSLKAGYFNDTGVFSSTPTSGDGLSIRHLVCLKAGSTLYASTITFINSGTLQGFLGVPNGSTGSVKCKAANQTLNYVSVGQMEYLNSTTALVPKGQG